MRNLPDAPLIISTGMAASSLGYIPWNETRAVEVLPSGFRVLSHWAFGASTTLVPTPVPLTSPPQSTPGSTYEWGVTTDGTFAGIGPGPDGVPGTGDDQLVWLYESMGTFQVQVANLPAGLQPEGLVFNANRTMAVWNSNSLPSSDTTIVQLDGTGSPSSYVTLTIPMPATNPAAGTPPALVIGDPGDSFRAAVWDDAGQGYAYAFINDASGTPIIGGSYSDSGLATPSTLVAENEIVTWTTSGSVLYRKFTGGVEQNATLSLATPGTAPVGHQRPHPGSLATLVDDGSALVTTDLLGVNTGNPAPGTGFWYGQPMTLTPGKVASFFSTAATAGQPPTQLVILTAGGSPIVGTSAGLPFDIAVAPVAPLLSTPVHLQGTSLDLTYAGPAALFFAPKLGEPWAVPAVGFAPGSVAHLALDPLPIPVDLPMSNGFGEISLDLSGLPAGFAGSHVYIQGAFYDPFTSTWYLSDARLVVIG